MLDRCRTLKPNALSTFQARGEEEADPTPNQKKKKRKNDRTSKSDWWTEFRRHRRRRAGSPRGLVAFPTKPSWPRPDATNGTPIAPLHASKGRRRSIR